MLLENLSSGFPTSSDTNQAVRLQKIVAGLNFLIRKYRDCTIYVVKTKALISCRATAQLVWAFVLAYARSRFFHDAAQMS